MIGRLRIWSINIGWSSIAAQTFILGWALDQDTNPVPSCRSQASWHCFNYVEDSLYISRAFHLVDIWPKDISPDVHFIQWTYNPMISTCDGHFTSPKTYCHLKYLSLGKFLLEISWFHGHGQNLSFYFIPGNTFNSIEKSSYRQELLMLYIG
jgi:hypothetical protein